MILLSSVCNNNDDNNSNNNYNKYLLVRSCRVMSRLAVVSGGSRGIGKAVARLLAERGCRVAVVSRNKDAAVSTVASLHGGRGLEFMTGTVGFVCVFSSRSRK